MKTKMRFSKQILSIVLALVMVFGMIPMNAYASSNEKDFSLLSKLEVLDYDKYFFEGGFSVEVCAGQCVKNHMVNHYHEITNADVHLTLDENHTLKFSISYSIECNGTSYEITNSVDVTNFSCENTYHSEYMWADVTDTAGEFEVTATFYVSHETGHSGTGATCITPALCTVCGESYTDPDNHEKPTEFTYSLNTDDHTKHDKKYACCGDIAESVDHSDYTVSASDNVLVKTCGICNHAATATLTADDTVYTGSPITTTASVSYSDGWAGSKEHGDIIYSNNLNIGDATARVTVEGKELTTTFKINAADISGATITLDPENATYNGEAYTPSVSVSLDGFGTLVKDTDYTVSWDKNGFTSPDTYTVRVVGINNFTGSVDKTFTINAATLSDVRVEQIGTLTYDGTALTPTVSANAIAVNNQPITFTYSTAEDGAYGDLPTFTEAGNYTVYYRVSAPNHSDVTGNFLVTVDKADATYTPPTANDLTYNTNLQDLVSGASVTGGEMQFALGTDVSAAPINGWSTSVPQGKDAGTYYVWYKVIGNSNHNDVAPACIEVIINQADQDAPAGVEKTDETISAKNDGKITNVDSTMEYRKEGDSTYTAITGTDITGLGCGTYFVRYKETDNYNASNDTAVTIAAGRKLTVTVPDNQIGYTMITTTPEVDYSGNIRVEFKLLDGYSTTDDFQIYNGTQPVEFTLNGDTYVYEQSFIIDDFNFTVEGVADITAPVAEIQLKDNKWNQFWNNITFGLFFKETQDVTITATDKGSGVDKIYYYLSTHELELDDVRAITDWQEYNGTFQIKPDNRYVIYAKVVDTDRNSTYISSEYGIVLDSTVPVISGIENGTTYYRTQIVTVTDDNLDTVTVNGNEVTGEIVLEANVDATYIIVATDQAGNTTTVTVTMKPVTAIDDSIDGITEDNVTSADREALQTVVNEVDKLLQDPDLTDSEKVALEKIKRDAEALIAKLDEAAEAANTENTEKVKDITAENVTPEDKTDLEKAKDDLTKALEDYGDNYTNDEKKTIEDEIKRINDALDVIEHVENVEELIRKIPENITKNDEAAINAADEAYNALTDYEKSLVNKDAKKTLDDAKAALAALNKPTDSDSPQTGDSGNLWLWFALLFISGAGIFRITIYDRKRKATSR